MRKSIRKSLELFALIAVESIGLGLTTPSERAQMKADMKRHRALMKMRRKKVDVIMAEEPETAV